MRIRALIASILFFFASTVIPVGAERTAGSIQLSSNRETLPPDGKSYCTITAQVRNPDGSPAPDGTEISFTASLGSIEDTAKTSSGVARVRLESPQLTGASTATITATWAAGSSVARMEFQFKDAADESHTGPLYLTVQASDYLAYCADFKTIVADGNVRIKFRNAEISAHKAQLDMEKNLIIATGKDLRDRVILKTNGGKVECDELRADFSGAEVKYHALRDGNVVHETTLTTPALKAVRESAYQRQEFDLPDVYFSALTVTAKKMVAFPFEKILCTSTNIYFNGKRMVPFSIPHYILSLSGELVDEGRQYMSLGTYGLDVNVPVYYSLTPSSSGAMLIRRGTTTGWGQYNLNPTWFVDLRQRYSSDRAQGMLTVNQVSSRDWGLQFSHSQDLGGKMHGDLFLDFPQHRDMFSSLNLSKSFSGFSIGVNADGSLEKGLPDSGEISSNSLQTSASIRTDSKSIGKLPAKYSLSYDIVSTRTNTDWTADAKTAEPSPVGSSTSLNRRFGANLTSERLKITRRLSFRSGLSLGYTWRNASEFVPVSGPSTLGTAVMDWDVSPQNHFQLSYRYSDNANLYPVKVDATEQQKEDAKRRFQDLNTSHHTLSANWTVRHNNKWDLSVYGIKGLDSTAMNIFSNLNYRFDKNWRVGVRTTWNRYLTAVVGTVPGTISFEPMSYNDLELSLSRTIGNREISAVWSKSERKLFFELGSGAF